MGLSKEVRKSSLLPIDLPVGTIVRDIGTGFLGRIIPRLGWPQHTKGVNSGDDLIYDPIYVEQCKHLVAVRWFLVDAIDTNSSSLGPRTTQVEAQSLELYQKPEEIKI